MTRVDASRATQFVARWNVGGKNQCKAYPVMQTCQDSRTSMLRMGMTDPKAPRGCTCIEQDGGC